MYIKHSKVKNTGILFEILVKRITADTFSGIDNPPALKILKKYFVNTELGKEYKLYEAIFKSKINSEGKANAVLSTIIEASQKLNRSRLRKEKYNIIKELKEHYNVEELFNITLSNYKAQAALYVLLEIYNSNKTVNPNQVIDNKITLLEYITEKPIEENDVKDNILEEFKSYDKDVRTLTYMILLERFNKKYSDLNSKQKQILKEFIYSVDSTNNLKEFYNKEIQEIKNSIVEHVNKIENTTIKIKLQEVSKLLKNLGKKCKVNNDYLVDLLQYHNLLEELTKVNGE